MAAVLEVEVEVEVDDSFVKPGSIPFKWEIRPGVPKLHQPPPLLQKWDSSNADEDRESTQSSPLYPVTRTKLRPPPAGLYYFQPSPESRTRSSRSAPRSRTGSYRFQNPGFARPEVVTGADGCFPSPILRRITEKKRTHKIKPGSELDYISDLETASRWSVSSRKSVSSLRDSPVSISAFSSLSSSPSPVAVGDAEWAGFGLF